MNHTFNIKIGEFEFIYDVEEDESVLGVEINLTNVEIGGVEISDDAFEVIDCERAYDIAIEEVRRLKMNTAA